MSPVLSPGGAQLGPKFLLNAPNVGAKLGRSWSQVGPSWAEVGAPSCGHVGSKWRIWMMLRRYATCANYQQSSALFGSSYGCLPQLKLAPVEQICQHPLLNTTPRHPAPDYYPQKDAIKVRHTTTLGLDVSKIYRLVAVV
jgi:hypothetical protein